MSWNDEPCYGIQRSRMVHPSFDYDWADSYGHCEIQTYGEEQCQGQPMIVYHNANQMQRMGRYWGTGGPTKSIMVTYPDQE